MKRLAAVVVIAVTVFCAAIVTAGPGESGSYVPKVVYDGPELSGPQNDGGYDEETEVAMTSWGGSGRCSYCNGQGYY